jgi:H+-transporting ATPase
MADEEDKGHSVYEPDTVDWKQAVEKLGVDIKTGLPEEEIEKRTRAFGFNEIPEIKKSPLMKFLKKFWGLTAWMLELTMLISFILGRYLDLYIIGALLLFNSILSYLQEEKASGIIKTLMKNLQVNARVLRDGKWKAVPARELVPGDIVRVRAGDFVAADLNIITGELEADQSALTGESMTAKKKENSVLYSGSIVKGGEANSVVLATGEKTYFGKTAQLVQIARPKLHMEEITSRVVSWLLTIVILLLGLTIMISLARGGNLLEILPLTLILLVSAVPVAFPAMFTLSMALGSIELANKGVLVTRLTASEDVATMDTLCADKTGTITMNRLTITNIYSTTDFEEDDVILYGALASQEANMDPIDLAFLAFARDKKLLSQEYVQKEFVPFDPKTKRTEAIVQKNNESFRVMKGALRIIAELCGLADAEIDRLEDSMGDLTIKGYRTLAVALEDHTGKPKLVGLVAMYDNPRQNSEKLIRELKSLGISIKMLTGDALPIAREIANKIGLGENIVTAKNLKTSAKEDQFKAAEIAEKSDGFAEIYPEDKYMIVKSLQLKSHVVGMTGDGVNDAPALKQAEVGIAVSNATDVAKKSASIVLTGEGLSSIVDLVKAGRMIYQRITTWTLNKIIKTFTIVFFVTMSFIFTGLSVINTFDIVLLLFLTDFITLSLSTDNVRWSPKPDTWDITGLVKVAVVLGIMILIEHFSLLYVGLRYSVFHSNIPELNTFVFEMLFFSGVFTIFIVREKSHFWNSAPSKILLTTIILDVIFAVVISTVGIPGLAPLPLRYTLGVIVYYLVLVFLVNDSIKYLLIKHAGMTW